MSSRLRDNKAALLRVASSISFAPWQNSQGACVISSTLASGKCKQPAVTTSGVELVCPESAPVPSLVLFTELGRVGAWFIEDCMPQISSVEGQYDTALFRPTFRSTMYVCCACRPPGCCIIVGRWTFIPSIIAILHKLLNGSQSILIITAILLVVPEISSKRWTVAVCKLCFKLLKVNDELLHGWQLHRSRLGVSSLQPRPHLFSCCLAISFVDSI